MGMGNEKGKRRIPYIYKTAAAKVITTKILNVKIYLDKNLYIV